MSSISLVVVTAVLAIAAAANGAAVAGRSMNPMVWPMPALGTQVAAGHIIGGNDAADGAYPHQVSMQVSMLWILEQHICGATIISENWVLTAAHCVKGVPWYTSAFILAGKSNLGHKEDGQQRSAIKRMFVHEKYQMNSNGGVGPYDIGLMELKTPLVFSATVKPAKLPQQGAIPTGEAVLTGWGSTSTSSVSVMPNQLQEVTLPIVPFAECNAFMEVLGGANPLADTNVCVGYVDKVGQGACRGDSGGPLIQKDSNGDVVVIGATSWGFFPCQEEAAPSVYTRVSAYIDWIKEKTDIQ